MLLHSRLQLIFAIVMNSEYGKVCLKSQDEWLSILHLATKWSFHPLRVLSIEHLDLLRMTSPVDKLLLGRKYDVLGWVTSGYFSLCERAESLTMDEGRRLPLEDVIGISEARLKVRVCTGMRPLAQIQSIIEGLVHTPAKSAREEG